MKTDRTIHVLHPAQGPQSPERRGFLKVMAASLALANAACGGPPQEQILPYVDMPEGMVPGRPLFYATAWTRRGYAMGVLVENDMGRPVKVEGNPRHPASLGATDVFAQASVLQLWDPDRSQNPLLRGSLATWEAFKTALLSERRAWQADGGRGLRILAPPDASPTLAHQRAALLARYPQARWISWDPLSDDAAFGAARLAFGRPVELVPQLDAARIVVSLDADLYGDWPGAIAHARAFAQDRRAPDATFGKRLYALEAGLSLTGAVADERLALPPEQIEALVWRLAARLGMQGLPADLPRAPGAAVERWEGVLADRLRQQRGAALLVAGGSLSAPTRALVHLMNAQLGNLGTTLIPIAPVIPHADDNAAALAALVDEMQAGDVKSLVMLGGNPVYDALADLGFADALRQVPFSVHLGLYADETARAATWHLPATHAYEQWSDARAFDGSATIVQPLIAPLYGGRSDHELAALLAGDDEASGYGLVRDFWRRESGIRDFESFWQTSLRAGLIVGSAAAPIRVHAVSTVAPPDFNAPPLRALFVADTSVSAGEFANNAWLQELPRPFTKLTWDNAALLGPATAQRLGVESGDIVRLSLTQDERSAIEAPLWVWDGHAEGVVTLPLGYGRRAAGRVGDGVGFDAYRLRTLRGDDALKLARTGRRHAFATTQGHQTMEGRDIVRLATLAQFRREPRFANDQPRLRTPESTLYSEWSYAHYKWGMAIDLNTCIGCNACTIACQAENNIPVVGREEVTRGRAMHWIRVDRYGAELGKRHRSVFQPVPCMHCEHAPCEEVCPVEAAVHDSEGLNVQVYNRCVGTRFCSQNCPYKVRRFNFLQYTDTAIDRPRPLQNPDVTVRQHGVMEKCTYCVQRITRARIETEKQGRRIRDGEVVTACQAVCPTEAILFGDLNDPHSRVNQAKASPLDYALLAELNTRPRTTYAARVVNVDEELG